MFSKRFVAATAVAVTSFASIAGEAPASLKAADPSARVLQTSYVSVLSKYRPAQDASAPPDKVWKDANATVANEGRHGGAHAEHAPAAQDASGHAGHAMPAQGGHRGAHSGHGTPAKGAVHASHAGHEMPAQTVAPAAMTGPTSPPAHTDHHMAPASKPDPHAGHRMGMREKAATAARPTPAKGATDEASHEEHQQQANEAKK